MSGEGEQTSPKRLYVGNLSFNTTDETLKAHFADAGEVEKANVIRNRGGKSRGFGIVEYASEDAAKAAIAKFNESTFEGRSILVRIDEPQRAHRGPPEEKPSTKLYVGNVSSMLRRCANCPRTPLTHTPHPGTF